MQRSVPQLTQLVFVLLFTPTLSFIICLCLSLPLQTQVEEHHDWTLYQIIIKLTDLLNHAHTQKDIV